MDKSLIYSKTAKGMSEFMSGGKSLPREQARILSLINGKSSIGELEASGALLDGKYAPAIEGLLADNKRLEIVWLVEAAQLPKPAAKALLNLSMIAGDALVRGGQLTIGAEEENGHVEIVVRAEGPRLILDPDIRRTLTDGESEDGVTPRTAAAYLIYSLAGAVQVSEPADNVMLFGAALSG